MIRSDVRALILRAASTRLHLRARGLQKVEGYTERCALLDGAAARCFKAAIELDVGIPVYTVVRSVPADRQDTAEPNGWGR